MSTYYKPQGPFTSGRNAQLCGVVWDSRGNIVVELDDTHADDDGKRAGVNIEHQAGLVRDALNAAWKAGTLNID